MGAVTDRLVVTLTEAKNYLNVSHHNDDDLINDLLESAKENADNYLNNDFVFDGGLIGIPLAVKRWVLARVARTYHSRIEGQQSEHIMGLAIQNWGSDDYSSIAAYRRNPGL